MFSEIFNTGPHLFTPCKSKYQSLNPSICKWELLKTSSDTLIFRKESHNAIMQKTKPRSLQILKPSPSSPQRHLKPYKQKNFSPFLCRPFRMLVAHEMETETVTGETETDADTGKEAPAIRALGSLFRITQVFLWEDAQFAPEEVSSASACLDDVVKEAKGFHVSAVSTAISSGIDSTVNSFVVLSLEDMELSRQMNELGLPVSFSTNKEKRIVKTREKRRSIPEKRSSGRKRIQEQLIDVSRVSEEESSVQPIVCQDNTNTYCITTNGQHDTSSCCLAEDDSKQQFLSGDGDYICPTTRVLATTSQDHVCKENTGVAKLYDMSRDDVLDSTALKNDTGVTTCSSPSDAENFLQNALQDPCSGHEHEESDVKLIEFEKSEEYHIGGENTNAKKNHDGNSSERVWVSDSAESSRPSDHLEAGLQDEYDSCKSCSDLGNWRAVWDDFYMRSYFYNIRTYESTWYPPPGMEYLAFSDSAAELGEMIAGDAENNAGPELAGNNNKVLDVCGSQDHTYIFQEAHNDDGLSSQPSQTVTSSMEHAALNSMACLIPSTTCSTSMHLDESEGNINCFGIKRSSDGDLYPVHSSSSSDTQEPVDRLPNIVNQLGFGEVLRSELQPTVVKSKTDELIAFNHFYGPEMDVTSVEALKLFDDSPLQVLDSQRSVTEACYEETEESDLPLTAMSSAMDEMGEYHEFSYPKKKKKVKTRSRGKKLSTDKQECPLQGMSEGFTVGIVKYWCQRYLLFSRFDDGIKMDEEGWFSVTPEPIARHQASRCGSGTVIDCFTGVGGNAIQFAKRCKHVIAIDIDPQKINYAQHNATIYGVNENIDFIKGDFFRLAPKLKGDTIFMSPPWGGPDYAKVQTYDISTMLKPHDGHLLFKIASRIASSIVMFLPRNVDLNQLAEISLSANPPWSLEVEKNFLNGKLKAITAYFKDVSL